MPRVEPDLFRRLCLAREILREDSERPMSILGVAEQVRVSPFHLIRRFEELFGWTPSRYRAWHGVERAKELLARGEHSVTEACMGVGFSGLGSFSVLFRKHAGVSRPHIRCIARAAACLANAGTHALFAHFSVAVLAIGTACSPNVEIAGSMSKQPTLEDSRTGGNSKMGVHYLEIVSNDADTLTELYQRMLGLSFSRPDPDLGQACVATLPDGTLVGIRKPLAAHEQPIMRTYLAVEDIERAVKEAEDHGAIIAYPPTRQGQRGTFAIVFQGDVEHGLWQR